MTSVARSRTHGATTAPAATGALDKLIDDLGSTDAVVVVRTFAATLSWRASQISRAIAEARPQSVLSVIQDLRNGAVMVGAEALVQWCRRAALAPHDLSDADEIVQLASGTHLWLESWLAAWPHPTEAVEPVPGQHASAPNRPSTEPVIDQTG